MRVCDCYRQLEPIQLMVGECLRAKNKPRVDCDGDESLCLFYSDRRRKAKAVTNADYIRAMTDEELARWIATTADDNCPDTAHERYCDNRCGECWLDWLKSPVEVDNGD